MSQSPAITGLQSLQSLQSLTTRRTSPVHSLVSKMTSAQPSPSNEISLTPTGRLSLSLLPFLWALWAFAVGAGCVAPIQSFAAEISVTAALQPPTTTAGEPVQLALTVNGSQEPRQPPELNIEGAQVQYLGPSIQTTLNNFELSVSITHRYLVSPTRIGEISIPPIPVQVKGQRYETQPIVLRVLDAGQDPSQQPGAMPFVECEIPRRQVYVGEAFPVEVRLLVPTEVRWRIERLPQFETDAFTKVPFQQPQQRQLVRDGREYDTLFFKTVLTAIKSGQVPLGPIHFNIQMASAQKKRNANRGPFGGIFDGFPFDNQPTVLQEKRLSLGEHPVQVAELPAEGKPESFRGAIGRFRFSANAAQSRIKMGEPLVMTLQIEGEGNFDRIEAPPIKNPDGWRIYPPEISFSKSDEFGFRGIKTFKIAAVPETNQSQSPVFEFAAFDPDSGSYQTQQSIPAGLTVDGAPKVEQQKVPQETAAALPDQSAKKQKEPAVEEAPQAAPVLLENAQPAVDRHEFWKSREWFWGIQAALGAGLLLGVLLRWNARRIAKAGPAPRLLREATRIQQQLLSSAERESFFRQAKRVLQLRAAAKNGLPADAMDLSDVSSALSLDEARASDLRWLFDADANLRFGGMKSHLEIKGEERERVRSLLEAICR